MSAAAITASELQNIIEAALSASGKPLSMQTLVAMFADSESPVNRDDIKAALTALEASLAGRGVELVQVASGYRLQVRQTYAPWVSKLWAEKPVRYSRALLETLALIAYRQPVTRGDIEQVRGVAVSSNIVRTLLEREWVRIIGHKEVPGRPAMYATTKQFLDYFNLRSLEQLPSLGEIKDLDALSHKLAAATGEPPASDETPAEAAADSVPMPVGGTTVDTPE